MERHQVGVVQDLFRYPVKSMLGERLSAVDMGEHGVIGDRAYALRESNGRVVTAKKWANMLEFCACYDVPPTPGALAPLRITLPAEVAYASLERTDSCPAGSVSRPKT